MDYIHYNPPNTTLVITRNPFGFVNKTRKNTYEGVRIGDRGEMNDADFMVKIITGREFSIRTTNLGLSSIE